MSRIPDSYGASFWGVGRRGPRMNVSPSRRPARPADMMSRISTKTYCLSMLRDRPPRLSLARERAAGHLSLFDGNGQESVKARSGPGLTTDYHGPPGHSGG